MTSTERLSKEQMQQQVVAALRKSIEVPGKVLMVLHPYQHPIVLSRAWCLVSERAIHKRSRLVCRV